MPIIISDYIKPRRNLTTNMPAMEQHTRPSWYKCRTMAMILLLVGTIILILIRLYSNNKTHSQYVRWRRYDFEKRYILKQDRAEQFGSGTHLTPCEQKANDHLMRLKWLEYEKWESNKSSPLFDNNIRRMRENLVDSKIYKLIQKMPKGAVLHVNDVGMVDIDFLIRLTYYDNLWICITPFDKYMKLRFGEGLNKTNTSNHECNWFLLREYRNLHGVEKVDAKLRDGFTIKTNSEGDILVKRPQKRIKELIYGLITYAPVWKAFCQRALDGFLQDGVQYVEIRSEIKYLYDLGGLNSSQLDAVMILKNVSEELSLRNASFIGSKIIYTPSRNMPTDEMEKIFYNALVLKFVFQDYLAGIDLVADEPYSRPLREFAKSLIEHEGHLNYYLTVSEAQWSDLNCEENLIDACILNSQRLVFSYPLLQHPYLIRQFHKFNAALIVNPISHQLLKTPGSTYYHPAAILFAFNLNLVISSDYPALWGANPLSHDFYLAFMKIAPRSADLRVLKQLIYNSIMYSAMTEMEQDYSLKLIKMLWDRWICEINNDAKW